MTIALIGGEFDGRFLDRASDAYKPGQSFAVMDGDITETYRMETPGVAACEDVYVPSSQGVDWLTPLPTQFPR
jgi:hypothetical protein